jgi:hypothetical protein
MDLIGPLQPTPRGFKYIMTIVDYYSKWAEAGPLMDKTAPSVAEFLYLVSSMTFNMTCVYVYMKLSLVQCSIVSQAISST